MSIDVRINDQSLRGLLSAPPKITDQANAICRVLELQVVAATGLDNSMGQPVELWYNGKRWFYGFLLRRKRTSDRVITYKAYDPLYYFKKTPDDYYVKNMTATQGFKYLAQQVGIKTYQLADTGAVFDALYYSKAAPDQIAIDLLARTYKQNKRKFWFRYNPGTDSEGLYLFERTVPEKIWTFVVGVNLTSASFEESAEDTRPVVKLVNRETGKTVVVKNDEALMKYGHMIHFEEVDKKEADTMETKAQELLDKLSKLTLTMDIAGFNPNAVMPQFFGGDVIYVEEELSGLIGGYYIKNITQTFENDSLINISAEIQEAPDVPEIQYQDQEKEQKELAAVGFTTDGGQGVSSAGGYSDRVKAIIDKYGLQKGGS